MVLVHITIFKPSTINNANLVDFGENVCDCLDLQWSEVMVEHRKVVYPTHDPSHMNQIQLDVRLCGHHLQIEEEAFRTFMSDVSKQFLGAVPKSIAVKRE